MRFNRTLTFGILGCLVVGSLIGASQASIEGSFDDSPMTIPVSRLGDRVTYVEFQRPNDLPAADPAGVTVTATAVPARDSFFLDGAQSVAGNGAAKEETDVERWSRVSTLELVALDKALDATGDRRDVVVISGNHRHADDADAGSPDEDHTQREYVDLAARIAVQGQQAVHVGAPFDWDLASRWFSSSESSIPGLDLQGRTLQLGQDLTSDWMARRTLFDQDGGLEAPDDGSLISESQRRWVAGRGIVNGIDAYAVRTEHSVVARISEAEREAFALFFQQKAGDTVRGHQSEVVWISASKPYPLLVESLFRVETGEAAIIVDDSYVVLQEDRAGTGTLIAWGDEALRPLRERNDSVERSPPGSVHPADGTGSRLAYPLSAAINDVRGDILLVNFQRWREQNPVHYLVSAELGPGERSTDAGSTSMWRLVFATTNGNGHEVTTERVNPALRPLSEERGDKTIEPFTVADLPQEPVTLAAAERYWLELAGDRYQGKAPNYVHWGLDLSRQSGTACVSRSWTTVSPSAHQLGQLEIGYSNDGSCIDQPRSHDESVLSMDTRSGNLTHMWEWFIDYGSQPLGAFTTESKPIQIQSKTAPFTPRPPDVQKAAVASTSLLALFLFVYFLPALKFVGVKGLLLLPGYAKLRKEELLDNKIRDQILQVVRNDPGVHTTDLQQRVDAGWGTTVYHLGVLEKNGLISSLVDGRYHRFFPVGVVDFSLRGQLAVLKNARTKSIYELIAQDPGIVQESLARNVGISAPAAIFHLKRLEEVGMVGRVKKGRKVHYYANEKPRIVPPTDPKDSMEFA